MTQMLYVPLIRQHGLRGGLRRPCERCGEMFLKRGRFFKLCDKCTETKKIEGQKNKLQPDSKYPHCSKCNKKMTPTIGYIFVARRFRKEHKNITQSVEEKFCDACWNGIIEREGLISEKNKEINRIKIMLKHG